VLILMIVRSLSGTIDWDSTSVKWHLTGKNGVQGMSDGMRVAMARAAKSGQEKLHRSSMS